MNEILQFKFNSIIKTLLTEAQWSEAKAIFIAECKRMLESPSTVHAAYLLTGANELEVKTILETNIKFLEAN